MADKPERPGKERVQNTPVPSRPKLFEFLESHFSKSEQPNFVCLHQAYGPGLRKYAVSAIFQKEFKPNQPQPTREILVALSNQLSSMAQENCDAINKPHGYSILMRSHSRGDAPYGVYVFKLKPIQRGDYDPENPDEEDYEDGITPDIKRRDSLLEYSITHIKTADENHRWQQDQFSQAMGDILAKYQELATQLMHQNLEMQKEHRELFKVADEALSKKAERELAAEMQKVKIGILHDGVSYVKKMIPVVVQQLKGKEAGPGEPSPESIGVQEFLNDLTDKQAEQLFGEVEVVDGKGQCKYDGIFNKEQVDIIFGVANLRLPPAALDGLIAGVNAIRQDQLTAAMEIISMQQAAPLQALLMIRQKKLMETSQQQQAS